jgi:hypothetical protein
MQPAAAPYRASGLVQWHETDVAVAGVDVCFWHFLNMAFVLDDVR